jgi:hypothetical protein
MRVDKDFIRAASEWLHAEALRVDDLRVSWPAFRYSNRETKKNPAFAGLSSFTERSILLFSFSFFSAPH